MSAKIAAKSGGYRYFKGVTQALGRPAGPPRPPTLAVDAAEVAELQQAMRTLGWLK